MIDETDPVAGSSPGHPCGLFVHEFAQQAVWREPANNTHDGAMDVDRVVHKAVEAAGLDLDQTAAVGNMDAVVMAG